MAADLRRRYLLIGNGPAGWAAAEAIRQRDPGGAITILSQEGPAFYSRPGLAYLLTGAIPEKALFARSPADYRRLNIEVLPGRAVRIHPQARQVELHDGRMLPYGAVLLAVGAQAIRPDLPGIDLQGVVTLDTLADARAILRLARRARRAVVVGGGITALELAEGLAVRGVETHYLLRKDRYWGNVLDEHESVLIEGRLEHEGVRLHRRTELLEIVGRRGQLRAVHTSTGDLPTDILAIAIGIAPRTELARDCGARVGRGILVDATMQTSLPGIYAAGDVAEVLDPATGKTVLDSLWWLALEQGRCAGMNMAGARVPYHRPAAFNVTRIGGITTTILGAVGSGRGDDDLVAIARGDSEAWRLQADALAVETGEEYSRIRLLLGERTIVGAVIMGDQALSRPLQQLIQAGADIRPVRQQLLGDPSSLGGTLHRFWQTWRAQAGTAQANA